MSGWIGVDLDGTLAVYRGWNGGAIGEPVPAMVARVTKWLSEGQEVRILTARVAASGLVNDQGISDDGGFAEAQTKLIQEWCLQHIGMALKVTATKYLGMIELWDDRAVTVECNTGVIPASPDAVKAVVEAATELVRCVKSFGMTFFPPEINVCLDKLSDALAALTASAGERGEE